jgi:hypothetical protein
VINARELLSAAIKDRAAASAAAARASQTLAKADAVLDDLQQQIEAVDQRINVSATSEAERFRCALDAGEMPFGSPAPAVADAIYERQALEAQRVIAAQARHNIAAERNAAQVREQRAADDVHRLVRLIAADEAECLATEILRQELALLRLRGKLAGVEALFHGRVGELSPPVRIALRQGHSTDVHTRNTVAWRQAETLRPAWPVFAAALAADASAQIQFEGDR